MDRTERQLEGIKRGVKAGGHGTLVYGTGVGIDIRLFISKNNRIFVLDK